MAAKIIDMWEDWLKSPVRKDQEEIKVNNIIPFRTFPREVIEKQLVKTGYILVSWGYACGRNTGYHIWVVYLPKTGERKAYVNHFIQNEQWKFFPQNENLSEWSFEEIIDQLKLKKDGINGIDKLRSYFCVPFDVLLSADYHRSYIARLYSGQDVNYHEEVLHERKQSNTARRTAGPRKIADYERS
jgi:hypothetical protein